MTILSRVLDNMDRFEIGGQLERMDDVWYCIHYRIHYSDQLASYLDKRMWFTHFGSWVNHEPKVPVKHSNTLYTILLSDIFDGHFSFLENNI